MHFSLWSISALCLIILSGCIESPDYKTVQQSPRLPNQSTNSNQSTQQPTEARPQMSTSQDSGIQPSESSDVSAEHDLDEMDDSDILAASKSDLETSDAGLETDAELLPMPDSEVINLDPPEGDAVPQALSSILGDIPGYGQGTVGGKEGTVYVVTTLADSGPGSLRDATERTEPLWIIFRDGLNGVIRLESILQIESYKTIDARGHDITLQAVRDGNESDVSEGWYNTGVMIGRPGVQDLSVHDTAFINLTFDGAWPLPDEDNEGADGIHIHNNVHHIWIHQCTFHNWTDGAIDMRVDDGFDILPNHISITNSHFYDIHQGFLLEAERITFARNFCDNVNKRCINTIEQGSAHMVNNVIRNWSQNEIIYAKHDSQILVDHNIFEPSSESRTAGRDSGRMQDVHNIRYGGSRYRLNGRSNVNESFKREAQSAYGLLRKINCEHDPVDRDCWEQLYETIIEEAGANISN